MFRLQLIRCMQQDFDSNDRYFTNTSAWIKYEQFIIRLSIEKGFHAAQEYHWRFFDRIDRGELDLLRHEPFDSSIMRDIDQKYPHDKAKNIATVYYEVWNANSKSSYPSGKSSSSASSKSKSGKPRIANACPKHPMGEHTWDECSTNPNSPHYGDAKWKSKLSSTDSKSSTAAAKKQ